MERIKYELPGSFVYENATWCRGFSATVFNKIKTLPMAEDDVLVVGYPRSGTTWTQEIVWLLMHDCKANDDIDVLRKVPVLEVDNQHMKPTATWKPGANIVKSHLQYHMFEKQITSDNVKVIVVIRNVKDNLVSMYHFYRMCVGMGQYKGTWDEFFEMFKEKKLFSGDWLDFNISWWRERHCPNIHIVCYEDMKKDLGSEIRKMAKFLNKDFSDEKFDFLVRRTMFMSMKDNPSLNCTSLDNVFFDFSVSPFVRKGEVGDWKQYFNPKQLDYVEKYYDSVARKCGLVLADDL